MLEKTNYPQSILILALDQLIKQRFTLSLNKSPESTKIKGIINNHNCLLLDNLYSKEEEARSRNKRFQFITKLYGIKDYNPKKNENANINCIQSFINSLDLKKDCENRHILSQYFYDRLNKYIIPCEGSENKPLPTFRGNRLETLFEIALPDSNINNWNQFSLHPKIQDLQKKIYTELSKRDIALQEFTEFEGYYYSRYKKKIHKFSLQLSKRYKEKKKKKSKYNVGVAILKFVNPKNNEIQQFEGKVVRRKEKVSIYFRKEDDNKRAFLFSFVQDLSKFDTLNIMQGIFYGDYLKKEGEIYAFEFIAAKKEFLKVEDNYKHIIATLVLARKNFIIQNFDFTKNKLEKDFSDSNLIDDALVDIIWRIKKYDLLLLNYNKSGKLHLSKLHISDNFRIKLNSAFPSEDNKNKENKIEQSCNLSAQDKGQKVIATTYKDGHLSSVTVLDFNSTNPQIFSGAYTYLGGKSFFTTPVVAIIDSNNLKQNPHILKKKDIINLEKAEIFKTGLTVLKNLIAKGREYDNKVFAT